MIRGTTPTLEFTLPFDTSLIAKMYITMTQNGKTALEKNLVRLQLLRYVRITNSDTRGHAGITAAATITGRDTDKSANYSRRGSCIRHHERIRWQNPERGSDLMRFDVTFRELDKKLDVDFRARNEQIKVDFEHLQVVSDNVGVDYYKGDYTVTPKVEKQELATRQKFLAENVKIKEIPFFEVSNLEGGQTVFIGMEL